MRQLAVVCVISSRLCVRHTATHCNTLKHAATHCNTVCVSTCCCVCDIEQTLCEKLQHTATHCNTLQHTATDFVCQLTVVCVISGRLCVRHTATHCKTLCDTQSLHDMTHTQRVYTHRAKDFVSLPVSQYPPTKYCSVLQCVAVRSKLELEIALFANFYNLWI